MKYRPNGHFSSSLGWNFHKKNISFTKFGILFLLLSQHSHRMWKVNVTNLICGLLSYSIGLKRLWTVQNVFLFYLIGSFFALLAHSIIRISFLNWSILSNVMKLSVEYVLTENQFYTISLESILFCCCGFVIKF